LVVEGLGRGTIALDGPWQFHTGDDVAWADPAFDDSRWEQLIANKSWGEQTHPGYTGFAWYRRHIAFESGSSSAQEIALLINRVQSCYEVYWNGKLVAEYGKLPPHPVWYPRGSPQTFGLGHAKSGVLALRIWTHPGGSIESGREGGLRDVPFIGTPAGIQAQRDQTDYVWLRNHQFSFAQSTLYALVMLFCLGGWIRNRSQQLLLWMATYCLAPLILLCMTGLNLRIMASLTSASYIVELCMSNVSLWFLLLCLLELRNKRRWLQLTVMLAWIDIACSGLDIATGAGDWWTTPGSHSLFLAIDWPTTAVSTLLGIYPFFLVGAAIHKRLDPARWLVAGFACLSEVLAFWGVGLQQGQRFTHWTFADKLESPIFSVSGNNFNLQTISDSLLLVAIVYAVLRVSAETMSRRSTLEQEFKSARELQQALIPADLPSISGYALTSAYRPAFEVGGDFFQVIPLENSPAGSAVILLGDVSGKGLKAAMTVSLIVGAARMLVEFTVSPAELLTGLNRRLFGCLQGGFATCIVLRVGPDGTCVLASAGHPAPFLNDQELEVSGAFPLGLFPTVNYAESSIRLKSGDHLALYTDGLLEARNPAGELYSFDRLRALFATRPTAAQATEAAVLFGQDDDITVLTLTRRGVGDSSPAQHTGPVLSPA
jgi:hypothetical protein